MKLLPEDPRLTAYALGEIEDESERAEIEAAVAQSPELQAAVAAIRAMGDLLSAGFAEEPAPELSEFEKAKMEAPHVADKSSSGSRTFAWPLWISAAAAVILAFVVLPQRGGVKEDFAYQAAPRTDVEERTVTRMHALEVDIPAEWIEGTSQPVKVPKLDSAPPQAPQLVMQETLVVGRDVADEDFGLQADALMDDFAVAESVPVAPQQPMKVMIRPPAVEVNLPEMEQSFTVSSGLDGGGAVSLSRSLVPKAKRSNSQVLTVADRSSERPNLFNTEKYTPIEDAEFRSPLVAPLSTFSIDVDTASYANVRRFLNQGQLPPADAVRIEELINYFPYADAAPTESLAEGGDPFAVHLAQTVAPWNASHRLLRVALKGYEMPWEARPASNLVFLLDVSGSMSSQNKLPLVKEAMDLLVSRLDGRDRVAVVVYAGASGLVLPSTTANNRETIQFAMNNLQAGGSTNGGAGIQLAYKVAREHFIEGGNNRVILCTDGDFNVGQTNQGDLADVAEAAADEGVSLTVLGFGMGNFKDDMLEELSNKGKGSYAYVDSSAEARKVFLEDLASNIFKIAKDVKIQVEFNPAQVKAYRLIGYENRRLKAEDFNNDLKRAGDIGPGHSVVALYEVVPSGVARATPLVDALRYQEKVPVEGESNEVATVKLRYKQPEAAVSQLITRTVESDDCVAFDEASGDLRFGAAVAGFGMRLSGSAHVNELSYAAVESIAASALGQDPGGHRSEFVGLVRKARTLSGVRQPESKVILHGVE